MERFPTGESTLTADATAYLSPNRPTQGSEPRSLTEKIEDLIAACSEMNHAAAIRVRCYDKAKRERYLHAHPSDIIRRGIDEDPVTKLLFEILDRPVLVKWPIPVLRRVSGLTSWLCDR